MGYSGLGIPELSNSLARESEVYGDALRRVTFERGQTIYAPMTSDQCVCLLVSGEVRLFRESADGRRFAVATLKPGAVFGQASLLGSVEFETYAEAVEPCTVWTIADSSARELLSRRTDLSLSFMAGLSQRLSEVEARLESMAYKKVPARLAGLLLQLMDKKDRTVWGVTHQKLAEMLGTYRETVSQTIREFRDQGLVLTGRKKIVVLARNKLRKIAEQAE